MAEATDQGSTENVPTTPNDVSQGSLKAGERAISEATLVALPNPARQRDYVIHFSYPEFTCKCPMTGYPDFAAINIWMAPDQSIIELKSLKLWLNRFRDTYAFHEDVTNRILDEVVEVGKPKWARIVAIWNPRGNLSTMISAEHNSGKRPDILPTSHLESAGNVDVDCSVRRPP